MEYDDLLRQYDDVVRENETLRKVVDRMSEIEVGMVDVRPTLMLRYSIDPDALRVAQNPEAIFRTHIARAMKDFRDWLAIDNEPRPSLAEMQRLIADALDMKQRL